MSSLIFQATGCGSLRSSHPDLPILHHHVHWCMTTLDFLFESWVCKEEKLEPIFMVFDMGQFWNSHTLLLKLKFKLGHFNGRSIFLGGTSIIFGNHRQGHEMPWNDSRGCPLCPVGLSGVAFWRFIDIPTSRLEIPICFHPESFPMEPENQAFEKETHLNQTSNWFHVTDLRGVFHRIGWWLLWSIQNKYVARKGVFFWGNHPKDCRSYIEFDLLLSSMGFFKFQTPSPNCNQTNLAEGAKTTRR